MVSESRLTSLSKHITDTTFLYIGMGFSKVQHIKMRVEKNEAGGG